MPGKIEARLSELNIQLPQPPAPAGAYVPYVVSGSLVFIAGQVPFENGEIRGKGKVGTDFSVEEGQGFARICALNAIAHLKAACGGDLDRVRRCVRLGGFVACDGNFTDHPAVINGASNVVGEIFGEAGKHARAATGASSLPLGVAVELESVWEIA